MPRLENNPSIQTDSTEFLREGLRLLVQIFIELEIADLIEATPHERSSNRRSYRNGYRRRTWITSLGELSLEIPKLRKGTYYPAFLDKLRQSEAFLIESLRKVYKNGVTSGDVEKIVNKMGFTTAQPDQLADIVEQLYDLVDRFRDKPRMRVPENLVLYRPVNAISTHTLETNLSAHHDLPEALYMGHLVIGQMDDWLSESLDVLTRVHSAMSNELDAILT